jgi:drug/metabolite transporter (DMT)-like permease
MFLGGVFIVASGLLYNIAVILLAVAARAEITGRGGSPLTAVRRAPAIFAQAMNLGAWGFEVLALARLPLTLARVLGASGQVVLLVLARLILAEQIGRREVTGAVAICLGIVAVGFTPTSDGHPASPWVWLPFMAVLGPIGLLPIVLRRIGIPVRPLLAAVGAGIAFAVSGLFTKLLADDLSARSPVPLLVALGGTGVFAIAGSLNEIEALVRARASVVAPVGAALQLVVPVICAPILFNEHWPSEPWSRLLIGIGVALAVAGAVLLAGATVAAVEPDDPVPTGGAATV